MLDAGGFLARATREDGREGGRWGGREGGWGSPHRHVECAFCLCYERSKLVLGVKPNEDDLGHASDLDQEEECAIAPCSN